MVNSSGSSPASLRPRTDRWRRCLLAAAFACLALAARAEMPVYLHAALERFATDVPTGWSYTLATTRNGRQMVERFDATRPAGGQWSLLQLTGRAPTAEELEKYAQSRPTAGSGGPQSNFQKKDIEPGSLTLVREDDRRAEFDATFRDQASGADKMLGHLRLRLVVDKSAAYIEKTILTLAEPYWPVLTVKMNELKVETTYRAPVGDGPCLPVAQRSEFRGRMLLIATEEQLELIYSDFSHSP
jgi:hypothetical protein